MSHLLLVSIGPVQDFIASARRTRDLWFGSHVLSELSKAAARSLKTNGADLIMPAPEVLEAESYDDPSDVARAPFRDGKPVESVGNKILALVGGADDEPKRLARQAREVVEEDVWREEFARKARHECDEMIAERSHEGTSVWDEQIEDLLEFYALWTEFDESEHDYTTTRQDLEDDLKARKNLRNFGDWTAAGGWYDDESDDNEGLIPKSSFDGARVSVLKDDDYHEDAAHETDKGRSLRLSSGEQLDAVGLVKRSGGKPHQFTPLMTVAAAHWLERAVETEHWDELEGACDELYDELDFNTLQTRRGFEDWLGPFPYDAELLHEERWKGLFDEELGVDDLDDPIDWEPWAEKHVRPVLDEMNGGPTHYVACIVADGDNMGEATQKQDSWDDHQKLSDQLSRFASNEPKEVEHAEAYELEPDSVRAVVEEQNRGILVYAGGDDVLAFTCVRDAFECAEQLRQRFESIMGDLALDDTLTLSVGIGIGHGLDGMSHLLELGRHAEDVAKARERENHRNALGVVFDTRSGGRTEWRAQWDHFGDDESPVDRLHEDIARLGGDDISTSKIYEIRRILRNMPEPEEVEKGESNGYARALRGDVWRAFQRQNLGDETTLEELGLELDEDDDSYSETHRAIDNWTSRLIVAKTLRRQTDWSDLDVELDG